MKVIYIAGPFRSPTHWGIVLNVRHAETWALEVWKLGAVAITPHLNTANFQGALPDEAWLDGTMLIRLTHLGPSCSVGEWRSR